MVPMLSFNFVIDSKSIEAITTPFIFNISLSNLILVSLNNSLLTTEATTILQLYNLKSFNRKPSDISSWFNP